MTPEQPYEMNPQGRFSDRAKNYAQYRPTYPAQAIDFILNGLGELSKLIVADIGAGSGIASRLLADRGVKVIGIEPNTAMRQVAEAHPLVEFRNGTAEQTTLTDQSVELVTCFQAFHWFQLEPTVKEFNRILKPGGKIALVWNDRDINGDDQFTRDHERIIITASNNSPIYSILDGKSNLVSNSVFSVVNHLVFSHQQPLSKASLIGLAMSASYIPQSGARHEQMINALNNLYQKYRDDRSLVYLQYKTTVYLISL